MARACITEFRVTSLLLLRLRNDFDCSFYWIFRNPNPPPPPHPPALRARGQAFRPHTPRSPQFGWGGGRNHCFDFTTCLQSSLIYVYVRYLRNHMLCAMFMKPSSVAPSTWSSRFQRNSVFVAHWVSVSQARIYVIMYAFRICSSRPFW